MHRFQTLLHNKTKEDAMNSTTQQFVPAIHDRAYNEMIRLFEELSLPQRIKKTFHGLNQPKDSGDYKFAVLQMQLLSAPVLALVITVLCVCLLLSIQKRTDTKQSAFGVDFIEPKLPPILDPIEPPILQDPIEFTIADFKFNGPDVVIDPMPTSAPAADKPASPQPAKIESVANIKSVLVMKNIWTCRTPGARGAAREELDGSDAGEESVMRALRWLKAQQLPDGSWPGQPTAMTGLALLSFLAHGEKPDSAEFGPTVERGLRFLIDNQAENGLFKSKDGNNYAHPIATYALCEAYTLTQVPMLKEAAEKAVRHIVRGQHPSGGWDYNMKQSDRDDTSYMGWCAQALKAAHMAGDLDVEGLDEAYKNAPVGFRRNAHKSGGFGYTDKGRGGLSGVGVLCMQLLGAAKETEVGSTLAYLDACGYSFEDWEKQPYNGGSPVYYWYYITQAMFHSSRERWDRWNAKFQPELIRRQVVVKNAVEDAAGDRRDIGYWDSPSKSEHIMAGGASDKAVRYEKGVPVEGTTTLGARVQDTCLSALQLMVFYRYLPTYKTPKEVIVEAPPEIATADVNIKITR